MPRDSRGDIDATPRRRRPLAALSPQKAVRVWDHQPTLRACSGTRPGKRFVNPPTEGSTHGHRHHDPESRTIRVPLEGEYDCNRTADLRDRLLGLAFRSPIVIADLNDVTFIDSSALRALLDARNALEAEGGALRLSRVPEVVSRLLTVTGTDMVFDIEAEPA